MAIWQHGSEKSVAFQYAAIIAAIVIGSHVDLSHVSVAKIAMNTYENLANVASMSAAVAPNPANTYLAQLDQRDKELTAREDALVAKESELDAKYQKAIDTDRRMTILTIGGTTVLLFVLIVLNFYFDIKREEEHERHAAATRKEEIKTTL